MPHIIRNGIKYSSNANNADNISYNDNGLVTTVRKFLDKIKSVLGTSDISKIGDGSVTGAITALNSNIGKSGTRKELYSSAVSIPKATTITLNDNLSYFKFIGIEILVAGTDVKAILQIDVDGFKKTPRSFSTSQFSASTPTTHYMTSSLKYVDDTHVIISGWGSGWTINYVNVYGIY